MTTTIEEDDDYLSVNKVVLNTSFNELSQNYMIETNNFKRPFYNFCPCVRL